MSLLLSSLLSAVDVLSLKSTSSSLHQSSSRPFSTSTSSSSSSEDRTVPKSGTTTLHAVSATAVASSTSVSTRAQPDTTSSSFTSAALEPSYTFTTLVPNPSTLPGASSIYEPSIPASTVITSTGTGGPPQVPTVLSSSIDSGSMAATITAWTTVVVPTPSLPFAITRTHSSVAEIAGIAAGVAGAVMLVLGVFFGLQHNKRKRAPSYQFTCMREDATDPPNVSLPIQAPPVALLPAKLRSVSWISNGESLLTWRATHLDHHPSPLAHSPTLSRSSSASGSPAELEGEYEETQAEPPTPLPDTLSFIEVAPLVPRARAPPIPEDDIVPLQLRTRTSRSRQVDSGYRFLMELPPSESLESDVTDLPPEYSAD